jgi:anti-anti-sigma factor
VIGFSARTDAQGVIWLSGELDMATSPEFRAVALAAVDGRDRLVIDLSELSFLGSAGIRELLSLADQTRSGIVLRSPAGNVRRVLEITNVDQANGVEIQELDEAVS